MALSLWRPFGLRVARPAATPGRRTLKLWLETLEDRSLPTCLSPLQVCTVADTGGNSLRDVIRYVNTLAPSPFPYLISFNLPGSGVGAIHLNSPLPTVQRAVIIDGTTQPGYFNHPVVELDGTAAGPNTSGLVLTAGNSTVAGLSIHSFSDSGIKLQGGVGNLVAADYIGTDARGTTALGNRVGVSIVNGSSGNTVGGTSPALGNLISGNGDGVALSRGAHDNMIQGNFIGTDPRGTTLIPNTNGVTFSQAASNNTLGGAMATAGNVIAASRNDAVFITDPGTTGNVVAANRIGTDPTGTVPLSNLRGVEIRDTAGNTVGGATATAGNVIAASQAEGVLLTGSATGNVVLGNFIGTDATGTASLGNRVGVAIQAAGNTVGGPAAARNVISGNVEQGVLLAGGARGNVVQGNYVGTDAGGAAPLPNGIGVYLLGASGNTVGGTDPGAGNLISGNTVAGVGIVSVLSAGNVIAGNLIGTDAGGSSPVPNSVGVLVSQTSAGNTVGGLAAGAGNVIAGNTAAGVLIDDGATGTVVQGNDIGTDVTRSLALGNGGPGVEVRDASGNMIGGDQAGAGNFIAFNGDDGVLIDTGTADLIRGNAVFANADLGIELANGGNNGQPFPWVTSAVSDGQTLALEGVLYSTPGTDFVLEFFADTVCDPSGFGEGEVFLNVAVVTTDDGGTATFSVVLDGGADPGQFVAATATDPGGNTSSFSPCLQVADAGGAPAPGGDGLTPAVLNAARTPTPAVSAVGVMALSPAAVDSLFIHQTGDPTLSRPGRDFASSGDGSALVHRPASVSPVDPFQEAPVDASCPHC